MLKVKPSGHLYMPGSGRTQGNIFLSASLAGEQVGLRELEDGTWLVSYIDIDLGRLDLQQAKITPFDPANPSEIPTTKASLG